MPPESRLHVLLVEDAEGDSQLIAAMLRRVRGEQGLLLTRVRDTASACRALAGGGIELVLLDLSLPDSHGPDTVRRVAAAAPEVPIIVLTVTDDEAIGLACVEAGAQDYLPKGELRVQLLGRVIGYALARAAETAARRRLEQEVVEIGERERRRVAHDLHDDLGQQLTGIAILARSLAGRLAARGLAEADDAGELAELVQGTIARSMELARGLDPLTECAEELPAALGVLARLAERRFQVRCRVSADGDWPLGGTVAAHLYRIAQEALTNAVRHGEAREIEIALRGEPRAPELVVDDDGKGIPDPERLERGQGLRIMTYRARLLGAALAIERPPSGRGTRVRCTLPASGRSASPDAPPR